MRTNILSGSPLARQRNAISMIAPGDGVVFQEGGSGPLSPIWIRAWIVWNGLKICNAQQIFVYGFKLRSLNYVDHNQQNMYSDSDNYHTYIYILITNQF